MPGRSSWVLLLAGAGVVVGAGYLLDRVFSDDPVFEPVDGDALLLRDHGVREGDVQTCTPGSCVVDGEVVLRDRIEWIALAVEDALPPAVRDATRDELHLRNGEVQEGPFHAIDATSVYTARGPQPRHDIVWIHLAAVRDADAAAGASTPTGGTDDVQPPPIGDRAGSRSRGRGDPPVEPCDDDEPLGGHVRVREILEERHFGHYDCRAEASFSFPLHSSLPGQWPQELGIVWKSDIVRYEVRNYGCRDVEAPGVSAMNQERCTQPPGPTQAGEHRYGEAGPYGVVSIGDPFEFHPLNPELSLGRLPDDVLEAGVVDGECRSGTGTGGMHWRPDFPGEIWARPPQPYAMLIEAEPSGCEGPDGSRSPDCLLHPDRYAVIPFSGSKTKRYDDPHHDNQVMTYTWAVCCGCADADSAPPLPGAPPADSPCGSPRNQEALLDAALDQQSSYLEALHPLIAEVEGLTHDAAQHQNDFEQAMRDCRLWGVAKTLAGMLASGGAPGAQEIPHIKEFWNLLSAAEKVAAGDGSWVLPNHEFGGWVSAEDAWDGVQTVLGATGPSSPQTLRTGLQQCGAPTLDAVLDGAYAYLDIAKQLATKTRAMHEQLNRIRDKDEQITDLWLSLQNACREFETCRGGDVARCDNPPQDVRPSVTPPGQG